MVRHLRFFEMVLRTTPNFFDIVLSTTQSFFGGICHSLQPVRLKLDEWLKMIEPHSQSTYPLTFMIIMIMMNIIRFFSYLLNVRPLDFKAQAEL